MTQNAGKLRDYYRIGKMLGSGKCLLLTLQALSVRSECVSTERLGLREQ